MFYMSFKETTDKPIKASDRPKTYQYINIKYTYVLMFLDLLDTIYLNSWPYLYVNLSNPQAEGGGFGGLGIGISVDNIVEK